VVIDTSDQRTPAQKAQADLATDRNAQTAATMEKARLRQEERDIAANTAPPPKATAVKRSSATQTKAKQKQKKKEPEYFAAQVPGEKASKKMSGKSTKTKTANKT